MNIKYYAEVRVDEVHIVSELSPRDFEVLDSSEKILKQFHPAGVYVLLHLMVT